MEAISIPFSATAEQSISPPNPYKQIKNPLTKRNAHGARGFIYRSTHNFYGNINFVDGGSGGGLFFGPPLPPSLSSSYPSSLLAVGNPLQQQPPLLPLPTSKHHSSFPPSGSRSLSCPPTSTKKNNRIRDHFLNPKKAKQPTRRGEPKMVPKPIDNMVESSAPLGPDPSDLPKDVSVVLSSLSSSIGTGDYRISNRLGIKDMEKFSTLVYTPPSPHPSSLPLPKFSVRRPKLISCTAEAGIDDSATDNLRRLLSLR